MRIFTCSVCQQLLFFENVQCTRCGHALGYLPEHRALSALERSDPEGGPISTSTVFVALAPNAKRARYRLCLNGVEHALCNWLVPERSDDALCAACQLNQTVPALDAPGALAAWNKLEVAKRRLLYSLYELELPVESRAERPEGGLAFAFKGEREGSQEKVFTGHADGLITINIKEADDPFREQVRKNMGEAYRTLLGHFRHEVGHYYWDRLIRDTPWLAAFRALFGDERADYAKAMERHYAQGAPPDWSLSFVSTYATMHPWEDWAETWAHYLHMVDTLGTAGAYGLVIKPKPKGAAAELTVAARALDFEDFDDLIAGWVPLTVALNSLNRSMGLVDPYPFVLSERAITKLRFAHDLIEHWNAKPRKQEQALARWPAADLAAPAPDEVREQGGEPEATQTPGEPEATQTPSEPEATQTPGEPEATQSAPAQDADTKTATSS